MDEIRLGLAAVEFNISKDLIVEILQNNGFDIENKPTAKLNQEMYNFVSNYLASDKIFNSEEIEQSKNKRFIGLIKWFHDKAKNSNYGFIQHFKLGDIFFHEKSIDKGQDIFSFKDNVVVIFTPQSSKKGKLEAIQVKLISNETDLVFLFNLFLSILNDKGKHQDYNHIYNTVYSRILTLYKNNSEININDKLFSNFKSFVSTNKTKNTDFVKKLYVLGKNFFPEKFSEVSSIIEQKISAETAYILWLEKSIEYIPFDYISNIILNLDHPNQKNIFNRCSEEEKSTIFFKILYNLENIVIDLRIEKIIELLKLAKEFAKDQYERVLIETLRICNPHIKLVLWLEDFHQNLEFNEFKIYTISLSPFDQKKFVKKVLKYIHEDKVKISIEELTSINTIDYDTSKLIEAFGTSKLDYSTSIILNTISELNSQIVLEKRSQLYEAKKRIFDLILNQINNPSDILEIKGFFDECEGRCSVQISKFTDDKGVVLDSVVSYKRNQNQKAKLHPICDGRKATIKGTNNPILDENGVQYWWCANQKCYEPSRKLHNSSEWEKYTLLDFLTILKIPFKEKDLEIYLSLINKANRFLKHLKCRECNHILKPKDKSNYAFWGINYFQCKNETCSQKGKDIYLTHCLNGKCEMEIDSRDSVKCKPDGFDSDKCGWYVCNYCHSCCSDEVIQRRMDILKRTGQEYKCQTRGHRNLGVFSCNKCGNSMDFGQINSQNYKDALKWFIENKDKSKYITNSGIYNTKHWFVFAKSDLTKEDYLLRLNNLSLLGFRIPSINEDKDVQLVSEPNDIKNSEKEILICSVCRNTLDLKNEIEKATAIKSFHNVLFLKEKV